MLRSILVTALVLVAFLTSAQDKEVGQLQSKEKQPTARQIFSSHYAFKYQAALRYNDYRVAKDALYSLLVENPQNDSILYSLSALYFQMQQYASAALTSNDLVTRNENHIGGLEVNANSLEQLGAKDKALDKYESLYLLTDEVQVLYKIAFLQYELGRYAESMTNADILLGKKELEEMSAVFQTTSSEQKEYPIKVALYNLKGLVYQEQGDKAKAKEFYNKALEIAPDFAMAKENLASVDK
ncbi:tetratricopeptide repeat protein [Fulvivirga sp. RKSG066]|uniref:tetratricopeptide repeat protein n=1 Tax=Fulvivirga aurantia TaxID=2529383 RepID=UPI0012BD4668|nr:tetratricopeptide repeat protein [Fulvivirga aurantia]MTI22572.1 tetratricopeptide repeat protein [Fulvivirga aurantia]